jgi:hypothetical protein
VALDVSRARDGTQTADEVFDLLAKNFGAAGLDILYGIMESKRSPDGARRAEALLGKPDILKAGTPALRVAVELRTEPCEKKEELFRRAAADGDKRALTVLTSLLSQPCKKAGDPCCFRTNKALAQTINTLKAREATRSQSSPKSPTPKSPTPKSPTPSPTPPSPKASPK